MTHPIHNFSIIDHDAEADTEIVLSYTEGAIHLEQPINGFSMTDYSINIAQFLHKLNGGELSIDKTSASTWEYKFFATGGRKWEQVIALSKNKVAMNFTIPDFWQPGEFEPHRTIRDQSIVLMQKYGLEKLTATMIHHPPSKRDDGD